MSNKVEVTGKYINSLTPLAISTDKAIGEHIVNKLVLMNQCKKSDAVAFYEREKDNFMKRITDSEELKACTSMSIFFSFMTVFGWGLSFEPGEQADVYLIMGNKNIAPKNQEPKWVKECYPQPSPYGKKKIRIQNGQIKGTSEPKIVYDCDKYREFYDENGKLRVEWEKGARTEKSKITGSFIRIDKPNGESEFVTFDLDDVESWKAASDRKNKGKGANTLYTSNNGQIDKHFFEGKTLTHAFKGYPKVIKAVELPETFVPDPKIALREGLDVSEFIETEDAPYDEVDKADEFTAAVHDVTEEAELTTTVEDDDDLFSN